MQSLLKFKIGIKTVVEPSAPFIHSLKGESACHLIHLEWDLERDPDRELEELLERDLKDKIQNLSNIFLATNIATWFIWQCTDVIINCTSILNDTEKYKIKRINTILSLLYIIIVMHIFRLNINRVIGKIAKKQQKWCV